MIPPLLAKGPRHAVLWVDLGDDGGWQ